MRIPAPLLRHNPNVHKNQFGHVLIVAGSGRMLGAGALTALAAMRSGAGLTTLAIPKSLNLTAQRKISNVIMTLPLPETATHTLSVSAYKDIKTFFKKCNAIAIGPGLTTAPGTKKFIYKVIENSPHPLVIDADALNALAFNLAPLKKAKAATVITPHPGEMARLLKVKGDSPLLGTVPFIEKNRVAVAKNFARAYNTVVLLKGSRTVVASPEGKVYVNTTGNPGMATAGSGDVLTGMIAAFLAQGLSAFEAAKWGAYLHGKAGDLAAKKKGRAGMLAMDIIESLTKVLK